MKSIKDILKLIFILVTLVFVMMFFGWLLGGKSKPSTPIHFIEINEADNQNEEGLREKNDIEKGLIQ